MQLCENSTPKIQKSDPQNSSNLSLKTDLVVKSVFELTLVFYYYYYFENVETDKKVNV